MAPLAKFHERYRSFIHRTADKIRLTKYPLISQLIAETLGTTILLLYADGAVAQKFFGWPNAGQFLSLSLGAGSAVCTAVMVSGKASPAILNPAFAVSHAIAGKLDWILVPAYIVLEIAGGYMGAGLLLAVYNTKVVEYAETQENGQYLTNTTGSIWVAGKGASHNAATLDQIVTTALLTFGIYAITEDRLVKKSQPSFPAFVGMVVFLVVGTYTANASSCLNPARDFGPRLLIFSTYWGVGAFEIDNYYFVIPLLAPVAGAMIGAFFYLILIGFQLDPLDPLDSLDSLDETEEKMELEDIKSSVESSNSYAV